MFYLDEEEKEEVVEEATTEETVKEEPAKEEAVEVEATRVESTNTTSNDAQPKSKMAAGLLGIFLGAFGVHNFYLGYTGKAIAQLLITLLSCGFLAVASEIWGLIEGILILTGSINVDGNGNKLAD